MSLTKITTGHYQVTDPDHGTIGEVGRYFGEWMYRTRGSTEWEGSFSHRYKARDALAQAVARDRHDRRRYGPTVAVGETHLVDRTGGRDSILCPCGRLHRARSYSWTSPSRGHASFTDDGWTVVGRITPPTPDARTLEVEVTDVWQMQGVWRVRPCGCRTYLGDLDECYTRACEAHQDLNNGSEQT